MVCRTIRLAWRAFPDYYPDAPGYKPQGRAIFPKPLPAWVLGDLVHLIRPELPLSHVVSPRIHLPASGASALHKNPEGFVMAKAVDKAYQTVRERIVRGVYPAASRITAPATGDSIEILPLAASASAAPTRVHVCVLSVSSSTSVTVAPKPTS